MSADTLARDRKRQHTINAYQRLFKTKDGEAVLDDLRLAFGMDRPAFIPLDQGAGKVAYDPYHAALRDGQRSIFLHIAAKLSATGVVDTDTEQPKLKIKKP